MLPLHQENQEVVLFDDEMNQEVILSIIFAGISIWRAGETENHRHELHINYQIKNKDRNTQTPDTTLILVYILTHNNLRKKLLKCNYMYQCCVVPNTRQTFNQKCRATKF
jgi:hypothetical protein